MGERVGGRVGGCAMSRFGGSRARNSALQEGSRASCLNHAPDALALLLQPCWEGRGAGAEGGRLGGCTCSGASSRSAWLGWARMPRRASSTAAPARLLPPPAPRRRWRRASPPLLPLAGRGTAAGPAPVREATARVGKMRLWGGARSRAAGGAPSTQACTSCRHAQCHPALLYRFAAGPPPRPTCPLL